MREDPELQGRILEALAQHFAETSATINSHDLASEVDADEQVVAEQCIMLEEDDLIRAATGRSSSGAHAIVLDVARNGYDRLEEGQNDGKSDDRVDKSSWGKWIKRAGRLSRDVKSILWLVLFVLALVSWVIWG